MNRDCFGSDPAHGAWRTSARGHLAAIVDDLLPTIDRVEAPATAGETAILVAAPGRADTSEVMTILPAGTAGGTWHELGGGVAERLDRWERDGRLAPYAAGHTLLLWCLVGDEGPALGTALILGRIGAMLHPRRVSLLWFAGRTPPAGRIPAASQRERALALAQAAVPAASISLHCLGWLGEPGRELRRLARRFA